MRLRRGWRALVREVAFTLDVDDGNGSPSLTKMLALVLVVLAVVAVVRGLPVSGNVVLLTVVALSAAFGRSAWMRYLSRGNWSMSSVDETVTINKQITERRVTGADDGTEPA